MMVSDGVGAIYSLPTMRQVRGDQFLYAMFAATRHWSRSTLKGLVDKRRPTRERYADIAAAAVLASMKSMTVYDPADPTQPVSHAQLGGVIAAAIEGCSPALKQLLLSTWHEDRQRGRVNAARAVATALHRFEILVPAPRGEDIVSYPDFDAVPKIA